MLKAFIKYKNENNEKILKTLNIDKSQVKEHEYSILNYKALVFGEGSKDIIYLQNFNHRQIKYLFNKNDLDSLKQSNYDIIPSTYKIGDYVMITSKIGKKHIVAPLENLKSISKKYDIEKDEIIASNGLKSEKLFIGQCLWL